MPQPKLLSKPWASDGLKNNIPAERNGGLAQEAATYAEGFPNITMTPISVGGKPPSGKDMNGVLYEISAHTVWQNQGGRYRFDQAFCDTIGGYPKGAVLINDTLDTEYISLVDANTHNPNSGNNTGKWAIHAGKGLKASTTQAGSAQLSSATNSDREDMAATPKAVKAAYDKAVESADKNHTHRAADISDLGDAIEQQMAAAMQHQASTNGYTKLANGLIDQWGEVLMGWQGEGPVKVVFPIAFTSECFNVQITVKSSGRSGSVGTDLTICAGEITASGFSAMLNTWGQGVSVNDFQGFTWRAIGK
ncbi:phage tail protein [Kingella oralis]|jgi:hypothetical protein|uniref:phage tail protein n=1 Tax=Kingella oralis TaxID=505 RepID=UPI002056A22D|nr:MAG TPA: tail fiber protein [Caudoviricetes sp.]DAT16938.1 MAG TPA: tail fiber protein [Caudoviricetes sp.]DAY00663.1 MAG TPA: tail fiber protein [Caudoviricetes sp.]